MAGQSSNQASIDFDRMGAAKERIGEFRRCEIRLDTMRRAIRRRRARRRHRRPSPNALPPPSRRRPKRILPMMGERALLAKV